MKPRSASASLAFDELIDLVQRGEVVPGLGRGGRQAATTKQVATGHGKSLEVAYLSGRRVETVMSVVTSGAILWSIFRGRTAADLIFPDAGVNEPQLGPFVMFTMFVSWFLAYRVTEDRVRRNERLGIDSHFTDWTLPAVFAIAILVFTFS